jgi:hypothetical protein
LDLIEFLIRRYENAITEIDASILGFHKIPEYLSSKIKGLKIKLNITTKTIILINKSWKSVLK